ncbi:MAG: substrate-binding domain-containing protein [Ruminococcus sp.]|nr:substrate-binding domain-containing protein [Ruminococcus sp.]MBR2284684.1 substrate-binding domain-containing protein [Ruminococcus sp.]
MNKRPLIGIITARASGVEQRQILSGILSQADKLGAAVGIISNVYNFSEYYADVEVENKIYELISSERFDGFILTAESVLDPVLQKYIMDKLTARSVPVVVTGARLEGYPCVNNDVREDLRDIARHLTDVHGFTDIDMITGHEYLDTSQERVSGVRDILSERGIELGSNKVIYGNFWTNSGEELADEYISGKRRLPQAVICANDYMAYGLIDRFFSAGIRPPADVSVVGYEYVGERFYHSPILTTYQRNRAAVGAKALSLLYSMIMGTEPEDIPLSGYMVCGDTCPCGTDRRYMGAELNAVRRVQYYNDLNLCGNFEQQTTVCRSIYDYIGVLQEFAYLIRDIRGIYLCLYENWCSINEKSQLNKDSGDKTMICYRVVSPEAASPEPHIFTRHMLFPEELPGAGEKQYLYFVPMFSAGIEFGYFIFQYTAPDGYDIMMTEWLKIAVNALMVLRMKNDITTLLECSSLSEFHDTATGLYNRRGVVSELKNALKNAAPDSELVMIVLRAGLFSDESNIDGKGIAVRIDSEIADCLKRVSVQRGSFCARLGVSQFVYAAVGSFTADHALDIADRLKMLICYSPLYRKHRESGAIVAVSEAVGAEQADPEELLSRLSENVRKEAGRLMVQNSRNGTAELRSIRNAMYRQPQLVWDSQEVCSRSHLSYGHFRASYKECFGISFHQDLIRSRISYAKYLLMTTAYSCSVIAYKCGYEDDKYFMRQFRKLTGTTPNTYRNFGAG